MINLQAHHTLTLNQCKKILKRVSPLRTRIKPLKPKVARAAYGTTALGLVRGHRLSTAPRVPATGRVLKEDTELGRRFTRWPEQAYLQEEKTK
jgi:hypothetical protein